MRRESKGATLGLAVACTLVLVALGAGIMFLLMILGGGRQTLSATDAGALNVATQALASPSIDLTDATHNPCVSAHPAECKQFQQMLGYTTDAQGNKTPIHLNLANFNRLVYQVLMVALNASADYNSPGHDPALTTAETNAKNLFMALEGPNNSLGWVLMNALNDPTGLVHTYDAKSMDNTPPNNGSTQWGFNTFNAVAQANSVSMSNATSQRTGNYSIQCVTNPNTTAYLGVGDPTNVPASTLQNGLPYVDLQQGVKVGDQGSPVPFSIPTVKGADGQTYVQGYTAINVKDIGNIYFVTNYGDQNTSLRSDSEYQPAKCQNFYVTVNPTITQGQPAVLPPNTFYCEAQIKNGDTISQSTHAVACVGTKAYPKVGAIPTNQYIIVDNAPPVTADSGPTLSYDGALPVLDNVTANELLTGVLAMDTTGGTDFSKPHTALFSNTSDPNGNLLQNWINYYGNTTKYQQPSTTAGIFNQNGAQASTADMSTLQTYVQANPNAQPATCNDYNSDGQNTAKGASTLPLCNQLLFAGGPQNANCLNGQEGAFDQAYYGTNASYMGPPSGVASNLGAGELTAVAIAGGYAQGLGTNTMINFTKGYNTFYNGCVWNMNLQQTQNASGTWSYNTTWGAPFTLNQNSKTSGLSGFYPDFDAVRGSALPWSGGAGDGTIGIDSFVLSNFADWGDSSDLQTQLAKFSNPKYFGKVTTNASMRYLFQQNTTGLQNDLQGNSVSGQNVYIADKVAATQSQTAGWDLSNVGQAVSNAVAYSRNKSSVSPASPPASGQQPSDELLRLLTSRIYQIDPQATPTQINAIADQVMPPGMYYIYYDFTQKSLTVSTTPPPAYAANLANKSLAGPDGASVMFSTMFPLLEPAVSPFGRMANPQGYDDLHDGLFTRVSYTDASGNQTSQAAVQMDYTPASDNTSGVALTTTTTTNNACGSTSRSSTSSTGNTVGMDGSTNTTNADGSTTSTTITSTVNGDGTVTKTITTINKDASGKVISTATSTGTVDTGIIDTHVVSYQVGSGSNMCLGQIQFREITPIISGLTFSGRN